MMLAKSRDIKYYDFYPPYSKLIIKEISRVLAQ